MTLRRPWVLLLLLVGCADGNGPTPPARNFAMGFTPFPYAFSQASVDSTWDVIRDDGDLVADHLDGGVPWQEAAAGTAFDPAYASNLADAISHAPPAHTVYLALTPINLQRDGLALHRGASTDEPLVAPWDTVAFDDSLVIRSYVAYCERLIQQFQPRYFAYAIEANIVAQKAPAKWPAFLVLAESTYTMLKRNHPTLPVFATIQVETLYEDISGNGPAVSQLLSFSDVVAISTYPYLLGADPTQLPADYFTGIAALAPGKPFAVTETGWPAEPIIAPFPVDIPGSEALQAAYVRRLLSDIATLDTRFVNWFFTRDYDSLWLTDFQNDPNAALFRQWRDHGLYAGDGQPRPGLAAWREWLGR